MFSNGVSLADIAAVTGNNRNDNGMWGGDGWWAWILLFAIFGWGNGGWGGIGNGNNGGGNCCAGNGFVDAAIQRGFDNQTVVNKLDGINSGICSLGYDQLAQMNGLGNTVQQVGWNLQQTLNGNAMTAMQNQFALTQQLGDCCCQNRMGQMEIINQMDRNSCATQNTIQNVARDILDSQNNGYRTISDQINAGFQRMEFLQMQQENANLRQQLNDATLAARMGAQTSTIISEVVDQVAPRSRPSYLTCNPNTGMVIPQAGLDQWQTFRCSTPCCPQNPCCANQGF